MKKIVIALFSVLIASSASMALANGIRPDFSILPSGTNISLVAQYTNGNKERLFAHQSKQLRIPASTQKIITALAALLELGEDFRFETRFLSQDKIHQGKLNADLILVMSGDPTFTRQHLLKMVTTLKSSGLNRVNGDIIINTSIFSSHDKAAGWSWNNLAHCYNTAPAASIIDGNCFYASISPASKVGQTATVSTHSHYPIQIKSQVITTAGSSHTRYCELDIVTKDRNNYLLTGCMNIKEAKRYLHFAVTDSESYIADVLRAQLAQQHISYTGNVIFSKQPISNKVNTLALNQSVRLVVLLTEMLKYSNNLIADTVFRTIGAHYFNMPGTWRNSSDAVRKILKNKTHIDLKNSVIADGSGLSRLNLLSAETMIQILEYMASHDKSLKMIKMLPIAGIDGTLQYRNSVRNLPLKANIIAKTGYLEGSYNLAGFIKTNSNRYIAFVQFLTGYNEKSETHRMKQDAIMLFEKAFYAKCFGHCNKKSNLK